MPQWASFDEVRMTTFFPISLIPDLLALTVDDLDSNSSQDSVVTIPAQLPLVSGCRNSGVATLPVYAIVHRWMVPTRQHRFFPDD